MSQLTYGGVSIDEAECVIRLDKTTRKAYINSTWAEWSRKLERLHGCPIKYSERDGVVQSAFWILPLEAVLIRRGKRKPSVNAFQEGRISPPAPRTTPLQEKISTTGMVDHG